MLSFGGKNINMNYVITYDIGNDRLRLKIAKFLLRNACKRIQKSVYLAPSFGTSEWTIFKQDMNTLFQGQLALEDSLHIIPIQKKQLAETITLGNSTILNAFLKEDLYFYF